MKATLQTLEGIESITISTSDGKTLVLKQGQPAVIKDDQRQLVAAVQRIPVIRVEEDDD